jgi:outer membrane protein OmpA-like peptidoglycan-associated protein
MKRFQIYSSVDAGRDLGGGNRKKEVQIFRSPLFDTANLEPHPNAHSNEPGRFYSPMKSRHPGFNLEKTKLPFLWRKIMKKRFILKSFVMVFCLTVTSSVMAYQNANGDSRQMQTQVASGRKVKAQGLILSRENDRFTLRDMNGAELTVQLAATTKIEEKKSNPFRGAKKYSTDNVIRGLYVEVEGRGDASGALVAEKIKFSNDSQRIALTVNSQVVPVENRVGQAETRLTEAEQNAQRLSGQVDELTQVANLAKGGAAAALQTAEAAVDGVNQTNERISSLDDYEEKKLATINFKVGSSTLTADAKAMLDEVATQAKGERAFVIEVRGFASADGSASLNDRLSERRADAVVRYLAQQHEIPLRRIILPFGYGESIPVADNATREGRKQNRRVEVKILVNRGLSSPVNVNRPVSSSAKQN